MHYARQDYQHSYVRRPASLREFARAGFCINEKQQLIQRTSITRRQLGGERHPLCQQLQVRVLFTAAGHQRVSQHLVLGCMQLGWMLRASAGILSACSHGCTPAHAQVQPACSEDVMLWVSLSAGVLLMQARTRRVQQAESRILLSALCLSRKGVQVHSKVGSVCIVLLTCLLDQPCCWDNAHSAREKSGWELCPGLTTPAPDVIEAKGIRCCCNHAGDVRTCPG